MGRLPSSINPTASRILILCGLLVLPAFALIGLQWEIRWVAAYVAAINLLTFWNYSMDKRRAGDGQWRIPESRLHLLELMGGWPAAYAAQQWLRHKSSKLRYRITFWCIVVLHQLLAVDALLGWRYTELISDSVELILKQ